MSIWVYDLETYPNWFSAGFEDLHSNQRFVFEISPRVNHVAELWQFLWDCWQRGDEFLGFNNLGFDYPIIHLFMSMCMGGTWPTANDLYQKAQAIIDAPRGDWSHSLWESDHYIPQIDVYKLMHFNNRAKSVSLKKLEVAMRSIHVEDLPHPPGVPVPPHMYDPMNGYMCWDVSETKKFALEIWDRIQFRIDLDAQLNDGRRRVNWDDVKIGSEYLLDALRARGIKTNQGRTKIQTPRTEGIRFSDFILPVEFDHPDLQRIYSYLQQAVLMPDQTKGFFSNLTANVNGFHMDFGTGGLHGANPSQTYRSGNQRIIQLRDVESYYPRLAAVNGFYPEHLGPAFVEEYDRLFWERKKYPKGTNENALYKLALNGSFGKLNDKFSPLMDPQAMLSITVNGQLLLARLTEVLMRIPSLEMVQVNTDGVAYVCDRQDVQHADEICQWWMDWTGLVLEVDEYATFAQRDVNNYMAVDPSGKVKYKGAYVPAKQRQYHQDVSSGVVQIAVSEYVVNGTPLDQTIYNHTDPFDFMLSVKVPRNSRLMWGNTQTQNTCRYFIALDGQPLIKFMPPLKGQTEDRQIGINTGWMTGLCNYAGDFDWQILNRRWYLNEAEALVSGLGL